MPALNIPFTEAELAVLRKRSEDTGMPMTRLVHDAALQDITRASYDAEVMNAAARVTKLSRELLHRLADR
jgi:hypothetical protein